MSEELSKIEKPPVSQFASGRRLLLVPLFVKQTDASVEYAVKLEKYWQQVEEQIKNFESKLGRISRIYHEFVLPEGKGGLEGLKKLNETTHRISEDLLAKGAVLEDFENAELLTELSDWYRCLSVGLENPKVFSRVYEAYQQASKNRNESMSKQIDETLKPDEIGILFISEQSKIIFPQSVEVFYIAPPALDELNRWLREKHAAEETGASEEEHAAGVEKAGKDEEKGEA